jgi:acyl-CoA synthetase (AMP-forming)/AMP-acid ligase II
MTGWPASAAHCEPGLRRTRSRQRGADPAVPPTIDDLTSRALGKLASYKKPTGIVILDQLQRHAAGKALKHELRAR